MTLIVMSESSSGLHDHAGFWLRRLSDKVHISFERKLALHGATVSRWSVLVTLFRGEGETVGEIALYLQTDAAAVSRLVDRLQEKGLVQREEDPTSRRRVPIHLTTTGRALTPTLIELANRNDESFFEVLSAEEHTQLMSLLQRHDRHADTIVQEN
jgi:DNA-binding MarR family transcriptional regulator